MFGVGAPFFLGVGFHHPHTKWLVPRSLYDRLERTTTVEVPDPAARYVGAPRFAFGDINIGDTMVQQSLLEKIPRSKGDSHEAVRREAFNSHQR